MIRSFMAAALIVVGILVVMAEIVEYENRQLETETTQVAP